MFTRDAIIFLATISFLTGAKLDRVELEWPRSVKALRLSAGKIRIDGVLDDEAWQDVTFNSGFVQRDPYNGEAPTELTEFAVIYDNEYIYVAIKAHDSSWTGINSALSRRDEMVPSDWVSISFDSYGDYRTAFEFWQNPKGVKLDLRRFDDENQDLNWDAIWEGKASVQDFGWAAEFRIPFRELRFSDEKAQDWGMQVHRYLFRKNETAYWSYWGKEESGHVRHYGRLTNLENIPRQRRVYVSPYTTGQLSVSKDYVTPVHPEQYNMAPNLGADIKVGLSNNLTLDLTLNPDFGQVEADPAEMNISAFETFFPEKRPFFMEGGNIFQVMQARPFFSMGQRDLFYSRRIGRSPQYSPDYDNGYIDAPTSTAILAAGKLSGKTSSGTSIGIMDALTAEEVATIRFEDGTALKETVEPLTNHLITRVQQDYGQGKTMVGGILTATTRALDQDHLKYLHREAYTAGLDVDHRFNNDTYMVEGRFTATYVSGTREAIRRTQENSSHYFQRPDAPHLGVDTTLTSMAGASYMVGLRKIKGEHWRGLIGSSTFSPGYEANDLGYHLSVDRSVYYLWLQYREDDPGGKIERWQLNFNRWVGFTYGGFDEIYANETNINGSVTFLNNWSIGSTFIYRLPFRQLEVLWGGPAILRDHAVNFLIDVTSDPRKTWSFMASIALGGQPENGLFWYWPNLEIIWRPTDFISLTASTSFFYARNTWSSWADYGPLEDLQNGAERYVLATREQNTSTTTLRIDLTLTPDLTIQFYGSPYISAGQFYDEKLVLEEHALSSHYDERFHFFTDEERDFDGNPLTYDLDGDGIANFEVPADRDFNYKEFNSNLVVRWEYQTGSAIYLVWSRNMSQDLDIGTFSYGRDMRELFRADAENVFMLKASYLLNL